MQAGEPAGLSANINSQAQIQSFELIHSNVYPIDEQRASSTDSELQDFHATGQQ